LAKTIMKVIVLMHIASEGPGTIGTFLEARGAEIEFARLYDGYRLPEDPAAFDAVVSMGGPMNVYEEEEFPFLREETQFLRRAIDRGLPVLGVCLGAQMIAKASGAVVGKSPKGEIGWSQVTLTQEGKTDPAFAGLSETFEVLQWHNDMFHIPERGSLLASSADCPHQALRYRNAIGLQFHVEVTPEILRDWFADSTEIRVEDVVRRYDEIAGELNRNAERFYKNFFGV
jgi:GMP synthase (glutamine-hydrolysing)